MRRTQRWVFSSVVSVALLGGAAQAEVSQKEILVRLKSVAPKELKSIQIQTDPSLVSMVNLDEGLVKFTYATPELADRARAELMHSEQVLSVSPNAFYEQMIHYEFRARDEDTFFSLNLEKLLGAPGVLLPPAQVFAGSDPLVTKDWALANIRMPSVSELESHLVGAKPVIVAVIDSGIDYNHEDLSAALWRSSADPRIVGYDFAHNNDRPYDVRNFDIEGCLRDFACSRGFNQNKFMSNPGHGTHCAGHVGAVANNSKGIRGVGVVAQIMGLKFMRDPGDERAGAGDEEAAIKSIDYAILNGAKVISASWGGRGSRDLANQSELKRAIERAQKAGVIFVVAAGNDGKDQDSSIEPSFPAAYDLDNIITVAATDSMDRLGVFSNYGAKSVHIAAPGVKIFSTTVSSQYSDVVAAFIHPGTGKPIQMDWDGTSMATPIVAGAVALAWAKYPHENYHQIRDRILRSARTVSGLSGKVLTSGVLDVAAALR